MRRALVPLLAARSFCQVQKQPLRCFATTPRSVDFPGLASAPTPELVLGTAPAPEAGGSSEYPVRLGSAAVAKLLELEAKNLRSVLRLTVNSGGCSGYSYDFRLEPGDMKPAGDDIVIDQNGAKLIVDELSMTFLEECEIDYTEEMIRASFSVVKNKLADSKCGCGSSFSVASF
ncbi:Isca2 [Symbiodinium natans]|uniref:Isca2 protein n=1 Tax=Symbiodinium natans TaxID=878477 RepID=A0A812U452_9DINO|nr:Isca2 [Symbiodinium natans]